MNSPLDELSPEDRKIIEDIAKKYPKLFKAIGQL